MTCKGCYCGLHVLTALTTQPDAEIHEQLAHIMHQTATGISLVLIASWLTKAF